MEILIGFYFGANFVQAVDYYQTTGTADYIAYKKAIPMSERLLDVFLIFCFGNILYFYYTAKRWIKSQGE